MKSMYRAGLAAVLAAVLVCPATPLHGEETEAEQACRANDYAGCIHEAVEDGVTVLLVRACGSTQMTRERIPMDKACKDKCDPFYKALIPRVDAQADPMSRYKAEARAPKSEGVPKFGDPVPQPALALYALRKELQEANAEARRAENDYEDCACRCRQAAGGAKKGAWIAAGAGLAAAGVAVAAAGGGGPAASTPSTLPPVPPGVVPPDPSGFYGAAWIVAQDARNSAGRVGLQNVPELQVRVNGGTITILAPSPFVGLTGPFDTTTQQVRAEGRGRLAERDNVAVVLSGTFGPPGVLNGTVTVGADGSLGGQLPHEVVYGLMANRTR